VFPCRRSSNYAFKPTRGHMFRFNHAARAAGGLTQALGAYREVSPWKSSARL
jgi:hypothetical protein